MTIVQALLMGFGGIHPDADDFIFEVTTTGSAESVTDRKSVV